MANVLAELVVAIKGDASDLNATLKQSIKESKAATAGFRDLGKMAFRLGSILTAFGAGAMLFLKSAFDEFMATVGDPELQGAIDEFNNLLDEIKITVMSSLAPALTDILTKITDFIQGFKDSNPELFKFIATGGAIVGVLAFIVGMLLIFAGTLVGAIAQLGGLNLILGTIGSVFNPLGLAILALAVLWKFGFLDMKKTTDEAGKGIIEILSGMLDVLDLKLNVGTTKIAYGIWLVFFQTLLRITAAMVKAIISIVATLANTVANLIVDIFNYVINAIEVKINEIISIANAMSAALGQALNIPPLKFGRLDEKETINGLFNSIVSGSNAAIDSIVDLNAAMGKSVFEKMLTPATPKLSTAQTLTNDFALSSAMAQLQTSPAAMLPVASSGLASAPSFSQQEININIESMMIDDDRMLDRFTDKISDRFDSKIRNNTMVPA